MLLLILLIITTSCLSVNALGCSSGFPSSAHVIIYSDAFEYMGNLNDFQTIRKLVEAFNSSSYEVKIELYSYDSKRLGDYIRKNQALGSAAYSVTEVYIITYINSMLWQPPATTERKSHILILLLRHSYPHIFMKPKIYKLKRAGFQIFTLVYGALREYELEEVASYPAEWHSYSRMNFQSSDNAAEALVRSACRNIEENERVAKKQLLSEVHLVGGNGTCQGRVELFYNQTWGTLSDKHWDRQAADVICRQLKCGPSVEALKGDTFGAGVGHVLEKWIVQGMRVTFHSAYWEPGLGEMM